MKAAFDGLRFPEAVHFIRDDEVGRKAAQCDIDRLAFRVAGQHVAGGAEIDLRRAVDAGSQLAALIQNDRILPFDRREQSRQIAQQRGFARAGRPRQQKAAKAAAPNDPEQFRRAAFMFPRDADIDRRYVPNRRNAAVCAGGCAGDADPMTAFDGHKAAAQLLLMGMNGIAADDAETFLQFFPRHAEL